MGTSVMALCELMYDIMRPGNENKRRLHDFSHLSSLWLDPIAQEWPHCERTAKVPL